MMDLRDARLALVSEQFRVDIVALIPRRFVHFHLDTMRVGPGVLTNARHLPGHLHIRLVGFCGEAAMGYFRRDLGLRGLADGRHLIPKIRIKRFEPTGHRYDGGAAAVGDDRAVVNVSSCPEGRGPCVRESGRLTSTRTPGATWNASVSFMALGKARCSKGPCRPKASPELCRSSRRWARLLKSPNLTS